MHDPHRTDGRNGWMDSALAVGMVGIWIALLVGLCLAVTLIWPR